MVLSLWWKATTVLELVVMVFSLRWKGSSVRSEVVIMEFSQGRKGSYVFGQFCVMSLTCWWWCWLQEYAEQHPDKHLSLQLMKVQIYLSQGKVYAACDALKALGDMQYKLGVVSRFFVFRSCESLYRQLICMTEICSVWLARVGRNMQLCPTSSLVLDIIVVFELSGICHDHIVH